MAIPRRIRIFLGSPNDVQQERKYVRKVINELNETVGREKDVFFDLYDSGDAHPGYGTDGQAIINQQIGDMRVYNIILIIMADRIGTPTPRDVSGTVEEFNRAVAARKGRKKPDIWLFFRKPAIRAKPSIDTAQQQKVAEFKKQIRGKGLFREYQGSPQFEADLRKSLQRWLSSLLRKPMARGRQKRPRQDEAADTRSQGSPEKRATRTPKPRISSTTRTSRATIVKEVKNWAMVDKEFYRLETDKVQRDGTVILQLSPLSISQAAQLRSLQHGTLVRNKEIICSYGRDAAVLQVQTIESETTSGKSRITLALSSSQRTHFGMPGMDITYPNYGPDEIASSCARLLLLNEPLPDDLVRWIPSIQIGGHHAPLLEIRGGIFPELWARLHTTAQSFLPKAWLWAMFILKTSYIAEDILVLELGPVSKKVMHVRFQGRRKQIYSNREPSLIQIEGDCRLEE